MNGDGEKTTSMESILQDFADYKRFYADAEKSHVKLAEDELDMLSAAGSYAAFMDKFGLSEDDASE